MGSDGSGRVKCYVPTMFQSTLPHGERRQQFVASLSGSHVSIHAPAWGATEETQEKTDNEPVSIHAPAWGATCNRVNYHFIFIEFQSTLPHGERPGESRVFIPSFLFQSTLPHGERQDTIKCMGKLQVFQSTLPHGERLRICIFVLIQTSFNPRSRMGSDCGSQ